MKLRNSNLTIALVMNLILILHCGKAQNPLSEGNSDYFGQKSPGAIPELFAPGIISTAEHEHSFPSFTPDRNEVFWTSIIMTVNRKYPAMILNSRNLDGKWSEPQFASFSGKYPDAEGCLTYDGNRFIFGSQRPVVSDGETKEDLDLWFVDRTSSGWSEPARINSINTDKQEMQPSVSKNGNMYFVGYFEIGRNNNGIYRAEYENGEYLDPVLLGENINTDQFQWTPFIARDESYLLFSGIREDGYGSGDIYISFRHDDGSFGKPVNLGPTINSENNERFPCVSPDGKYLFIVSDKKLFENDVNDPKTLYDLKDISKKPGNGYSDVYWVSAGIIDSLKTVYKRK